MKQWGMAFWRLQARTLVSLVAPLALLVACSSGPSTVGAASATPSTQTSPPRSEQAAPGAPACGDPAAALAAMSTRDKLAQLLMVGVTGADDARAVAAVRFRQAGTALTDGR